MDTASGASVTGSALRSSGMRNPANSRNPDRIVNGCRDREFSHGRQRPSMVSALWSQVRQAVRRAAVIQRWGVAAGAADVNPALGRVAAGSPGVFRSGHMSGLHRLRPVVHHLLMVCGAGTASALCVNDLGAAELVLCRHGAACKPCILGRLLGAGHTVDHRLCNTATAARPRRSGTEWTGLLQPNMDPA